MAKKNGNIAQICAFVALILSAILWVLGAFGVGGSILVVIKDIALLAAIALTAYPYAKSLGKVWFTIYVIVVVIAIVGIILGVVLV